VAIVCIDLEKNQFCPMIFKDHFSRQSEAYVKGRPTYPDELFAYLASLSSPHQLCWDCATGNGQAAISLSHYFEKLIATDASSNQIEHAIKKPNIEYRVAVAEHSLLPDNCTDLITVATAAHWFDLDKFYNEVRRVSKRNGILAIWTYSEAHISTEMDALMEWFMYELLLDYWPLGRLQVHNKYETLAFPFKQIREPELFCKMSWNKEHWLNYIKSWSAYVNYTSAKKADALQLLLPELNALWPDNEIKAVTWPLHLKCARVE
jgi:ubiquinone/menaquinone biosynthesis C-methylase UbiE